MVDLDDIVDYNVMLMRSAHPCGKYYIPLKEVLGSTRTKYNWFSDYAKSGDNVNSSLLKAIEDAEEQDRILVVPRGEYFISSTVTTRIARDSSLEILMEPGAKFSGSVGLSKPLLAIYGTDGYNSSFTLRGDGGEFNASDSTYVVGTQSATALQLSVLDRATVKGINFIAGDGYLDGKGDSGITSGDCQSVDIKNCYFQGWPDCGIYITGGKLLDDVSDNGTNYHIEHNRFYRNSNDTSVKRQYSGGLYINNHSKDSSQGFTLFGASSGDVDLPSGTNNRVIGNMFEGTLNPIKLRASFSNIVQGNIIKDWGMLYNGTDYTSNGRAVLIEGCLGTIITDNIIDGSGTNPSYAIEVGDYTHDGELYLGGSCTIDNHHVGANTKALADVNASRPSDVKVVGAGTIYNLSAHNSNTFFTITDTSAGTRKGYKGSTLIEDN